MTILSAGKSFSFGGGSIAGGAGVRVTPGQVGNAVDSPIEIYGTCYSFKDLSFTIGNDILEFPTNPLISINQVDFGDEVEVTPYYGVGQLPLANGIGTVKFKPVAFTFYALAWESIIAQYPGGIEGIWQNGVPWSFDIKVYNPAISEQILKYWMLGSYVSSTKSFKVGADALTVQCTFQPLQAAGLFT